MGSHSDQAARITQRPVVLLLAGLPGAGKSTLATALSSRTGLRIVDRDRLRAELFPAGTASVVEKAAALTAVVEAVRSACREGQGAIVDGMPFSRRSDLDCVAAAAEEAGAAVAAVHLACPVDLAEARLAIATAEKSRHPAPDRRPGLATEVAARFEPLPEWVVRLDASDPPERLLEQVLAVLTQPAAPGE